MGIHSYIYDYNGERLMKYSLIGSSVALNGQGPGAALQLMTPTVYVNGNYVTSHHGDWIDATRHYYMNSIRIASEVTGSMPTEAVLDPAANGEPTPFTLELDRVLNALDLSELEVEQFHWEAPSYRMTFSDADFDAAVQICNGEPACICDISQYHAPDYGAGCENALYWYHPDYLGNTEMVTDHWGGVYQFFHYSASKSAPKDLQSSLSGDGPNHRQTLVSLEPVEGGEVLAQRHAYTGSFSSRYQFNAKEFDNETGFGYYGARYYQPEWSVWLSVDPLARKYPSLTPYNFSGGNPILYTDPDGREIVITGGDGSQTTYTPGMSYEGKDDFTRKVIDSYNTAYNGSNEAKTHINGDHTYEVKTGENTSFTPNLLVTESGEEIEGGGVININMKDLSVPVQTIKGSLNSKREANFMMGLMHETVHASRYDDHKTIEGTFPGTNTRIEELETSHVENLIRNEMGFPLRTHYNSTEYMNGVTVGSGFPLLKYSKGEIIDNYLWQSKNIRHRYQ